MSGLNAGVRVCSACKLPKPMGEFFAAESFAQGRMGECKTCFSARVTRSRPISPEKERADVRRFVQDAKRNKVCADCKEHKPPEAMDFDHVPERGQKLFAMSKPPYHADVYMVRAEMAKCDLVCATCHRIRTAGRRGRPRLTPEEKIRRAIKRNPHMAEMMVARRAALKEDKPRTLDGKFQRRGYY